VCSAPGGVFIAPGSVRVQSDRLAARWFTPHLLHRWEDSAFIMSVPPQLTSPPAFS
jgi:hypothetical protein